MSPARATVPFNREGPQAGSNGVAVNFTPPFACTAAPQRLWILLEIKRWLAATVSSHNRCPDAKPPRAKGPRAFASRRCLNIWKLSGWHPLKRERCASCAGIARGQVPR